MMNTDFDIYKIIKKQIEESRGQNIKDVHIEVYLDGYIEIFFMDPRLLINFKPTQEGFEVTCQLQFEYDMASGIEEYVRIIELILAKKYIIAFAGAIEIDVEFRICEKNKISHVLTANFAMASTPDHLQKASIQMVSQILSTYICCD